MSVALEGRIALVTGAGRGIGSAVARSFGRAGAQIVVMDITHAEESAEALRRDGIAAEGLMLDVADEASTRATVEAVASRYGRIDILVNAAGMFHAAPMSQLTREDWRRVFEVNVFGMATMIAAVAPHMATSIGGRIVNIASIGGRRADEKTAVYSASKAAVISLTQSSALELAGKGIRVNAIAPGPVRTQLWETLDRDFSSRYLGAEPGAFSALAQGATPAGRLAEPEDIAAVALFLASAACGHMMGQTINVDGGVIFS
jgi:D-sorbitol dehydrogenase (acceptor)